MKHMMQTGVLLTVITSGTAAVAEQGQVVLTLAEAVAIALTINDAIIGANDGLDQAGLSLNLARSEFSTKIVPNVLGSFGQTDALKSDLRSRSRSAVPDGHRAPQPRGNLVVPEPARELLQ